MSVSRELPQKRLRKRFRPTAGPLGASIIEMVLVLPILLLLVLFLADAGYLLHHYLRLTHHVAEVTRDLSTTIGEKADYLERQGLGRMCEDEADLTGPQSLFCRGCDVLTDYESSKGDLVKDFDFQLVKLAEGRKFVTAGGTVDGFGLVSVRGRWPRKCILCRFFADAGTIEVQSILVIENQLDLDSADDDVVPIASGSLEHCQVSTISTLCCP